MFTRWRTRRSGHHVRERFDGHILGVGTASGLRFVVGTWHTSPLGAFTDVMVAHPDGRRELLAPHDAVAEYVTATYVFDDVRITDISVTTSDLTPDGRLVLHAGPLAADVRFGPRAGVGWALRMVPSALNVPALTVFSDPVARRVLPGVRTRGSAGNGRREYYCARDVTTVRSVQARWDGADLGGLAPVYPEPNFGFSSTPAKPALTTISTFIDRPVADAPS